jgi:hypothetical protein
MYSLYNSSSLCLGVLLSSASVCMLLTNLHLIIQRTLRGGGYLTLFHLTVLYFVAFRRVVHYGTTACVSLTRRSGFLCIALCTYFIFFTESIS